MRSQPTKLSSAILCCLGAVAFVLAMVAVAFRTADRAVAAVPRNYILTLDCSADRDVTSTFVLPSTTELSEQFGAAPDEMWIDLSLFDNGFASNTFLGLGPFRHHPADNSVIRWRRLRPASQHYYRVNGLFGNRWIEIGRGEFETPNCGFVTSLSCQMGNGTGNVQFEVPPASPIPGLTPIQQWIDLTLSSNPVNPLLDNGFPPDTFVSAGPFKATGDSFLWRGMRPGLLHHYRVNTLYVGNDAQWITQFSGAFRPLSCANLPYQIPPDV